MEREKGERENFSPNRVCRLPYFLGGEESGARALEEEQKADRGFGERLAAANAALQRRDRGKRRRRENGRGRKEGKGRPSRAASTDKRRTDDSSRAGFPSEWSGVHWFNYLAVRLIVAVARKGKECEM